MLALCHKPYFLVLHLRIPQILDLRGNPMTSILRYREHVVGACCYLNTVDGKSIDARSRIMMVNLHKMRQRKECHSSASNSGHSEKSEAGEPLSITNSAQAPVSHASVEDVTSYNGLEDDEDDLEDKPEDNNELRELNFKNER